MTDNQHKWLQWSGITLGLETSWLWAVFTERDVLGLLLAMATIFYIIGCIPLSDKEDEQDW